MLEIGDMSLRNLVLSKKLSSRICPRQQPTIANCSMLLTLK